MQVKWRTNFGQIQRNVRLLSLEKLRIHVTGTEDNGTEVEICHYYIYLEMIISVKVLI